MCPEVRQLDSWKFLHHQTIFFLFCVCLAKCTIGTCKVKKLQPFYKNQSHLYRDHYKFTSLHHASDEVKKDPRNRLYDIRQQQQLLLQIKLQFFTARKYYFSISWLSIYFIANAAAHKCFSPFTRLPDTWC